MEPLFTNWNKSENVKTEMYIKQKKEFEFKKWRKEIGGDICITGNLRFRNKDKGRIERWVFFFSGDAMGKSIQGAGGSIVMGALLNGILSRSASKDKVLEVEPNIWLKEVCGEIQNVFLRFDGHMTMSGVIGMVNESDGHVYYMNFEHPRGILYKKGHAFFIEEDISVLNYKFGMPVTAGLKMIEFYIEEGDQIILGSDGRDDIILNSTQQMNEDETMILKVIEEIGGDIGKVYETLKKYGQITDDFSMMSIKLLKKSVYDPKKEMLVELKDLIRKKAYREIVKKYSGKDPEEIKVAKANFYISYAFYKIGEVENAVKWIEPLKDKVRNKEVQDFIDHIYKRNKI